MNSEHQNPKTLLPRVIEEKPIVYDDIELEEVPRSRKLATHPSLTRRDRIRHLTFRQRVPTRRCRHHPDRGFSGTGHPKQNR